MRLTVLAPAMALLLASCGGRVVHIESDTTWSGEIDGVGTVTGRGSKTFALDATTSPACFTITKTADAGTLRVYVEQSTWFGIGEDVLAEQTTTEPGGSVTGCVR